MRDIFRTRKARLTPVVMTALFALAALKATGLWLNFSTAGAEEAYAPALTSIAAPAPQRQRKTSERLLEQLAARQKELDAREADLNTREGVIEAAELRLDASIKALQREKQEISLSDGDRTQQQKSEIGRLSDAYEKMKARDAARVFEVLDEDILIPVAAGMRTQSLAAVLAEMAPERARMLTVALANRQAETQPAQRASQ